VYYAHGDTAVVDCLWTSASELSSGLHVTAPHSFYTASRAYELRLQVDGNLAVYDTATKYIVWQTGTSSAVLPVLHMTAEGNLVLTIATALHDSSIEPLWQLCSHSVGAYMHIDDTTGTVGLYAAHKPTAAVSTKVAVPLVQTADSYMNDSYKSGSYNVDSYNSDNSVIAARSLLTLTQDTLTYKSKPSGLYTLDFQVDYHLILYLSVAPKTVVWQTFIFDGSVRTLDPTTFKYEVKLLLNVSATVHSLGFAVLRTTTQPSAVMSFPTYYSIVRFCIYACVCVCICSVLISAHVHHHCTSGCVDNKEAFLYHVGVFFHTTGQEW
jgi:hypothetical protein